MVVMEIVITNKGDHTQDQVQTTGPEKNKQMLFITDKDLGKMRSIIFDFLFNLTCWLYSSFIFQIRKK